MRLSILSAIKQNKSWLGLTFVFALSLFSGYSNPSFSKTPVKVQTEWVSRKEAKANDHDNKSASTHFAGSTFAQHSNLFSELSRNRLALLKYKNNPGSSVVLITAILASRNFPNSEEDSHIS